MKRIKISILLATMSLCMAFGVGCNLFGGGDNSNSVENSSVVEEVCLQAIELSSPKTGFAYGEEFSVGNLFVTAIYSDGTAKVVSNYNVDSKSYDPMGPGKYNIEVSYEEDGVVMKKAYIVTVGNSETAVGVSLKDVKTEYYYGEDFAFSGVVEAQYEDGYRGVVTDGFTVNSEAYNAREVGSYQIIVSYGDYETSYTVNVLPSKTAVRLDVNVASATYSIGEKFAFKGALTAEYEDGRVVENVEDYTVDASAYDAFKLGSYEIKVTSGGMDYVYSVTVEKATRLRLLMIGNSFSQDTAQWMGEMAKSVGFTDIVIGNLVIGGCDVSKHYENSQSNARAYGFEYYHNGAWDYSLGLDSTTMEEGIVMENWDFISLQQASPKSGLVDSYNNELSKLAAYVKATATNENVQVIWNMTWSYQAGYSGLSSYQNSQTYMYEQITAAVQSKVETNDAFATVSPAGTAIQNARSSYIGDNFSRDGLHLDLTKGRYIAGLTMFCLLTGYNPAEVNYMHSDMSDKEVLVAKESVTNALANKYNVTQSQYVEA